MKGFTREPLDQTLANCWNAIYPEYRKALIFVLGINLLAFGFEMSNLTLHHDDVAQIFIQDTVLGHFAGRFGLGWLNYYGQNAYFVPFLQMFIGILFMSAYGVLIARFWGVRQTTDIVLVASVLSVFPYMAQIYQYNTAMATYTLAHFLVACAILFSTKATLRYIVAAAILYSVAFSIYQSVIVNAATIFIVWTLGSYLYDSDKQPFFLKRMLKSALTAIISIVCGGIIYLAALSFMEIRIDAPGQAAAEAFSIKDGFNIAYAATEIIKGTQSFYLWPENYFPEYLKKLQLIFLACAVILCFWLPKNIAGKVCAVAILIAASLAPRLLQLLHPQGNYHNLTLTAYAVVIAGALMIINRARYTLVRNVSIILAFFLIAGYILQCSWISTVNHLNTLAHYNTLSQIMSRIRSIPDADWDGTTIAVVGRYDMPSEYPFRSATGVAVEYMDSMHMQHLANLMRDSVRFVSADSETPEIFEYAATHEEWPHPTSVGVVNGMGVVILSKEKP